MGDLRKGNFLHDVDKISDFVSLSKEEFLASYSYLTEEEYDNTKRLYEISLIEYCPHCETEVLLEWKFDVQICSNCGMPILPCSLCENCDGWKRCPLYDKEMQTLNQLKQKSKN